MSSFKFVSSEAFPEDQYTKEIVFLEIDAPARVAFIRKTAKNGGSFWSVASIGVSQNGKKEYFPSYAQDSSFLAGDIKDFLDKRKWETQKTQIQQKAPAQDIQFPF